MTGPPEQKTYLIAGATRGIGRGLVASLLQREGSVVIAGVRDPEAETARSLEGLTRGKGARLIVGYIRLQHLQSTHNITHLDVVIANAGKSQDFTPIHKLDLTATRSLFEVNTLGPLRLFQAVYPLLKPGARFLVMSSMGGSIHVALTFPFSVAAYGISKAAVNFLVAKGTPTSYFPSNTCGRCADLCCPAAQENPHLAITALHPGMVETDMAQAAIAVIGRENLTKHDGTASLISVEESVAGLVQLLEKPKEEVTGKSLDWKGGVVPW
ncbi:hypothetical protein PRZ48_013826 [Zasmidium cellare]|uniref:NAD(P)-binding protein n=1 Tax=Zasmidium cellare TaxID=395010 RepID=A0ABR0E2D1_ZASCE|nr:hypothetical protein PRZ48_013826 [Zasmidium cellare]